MHLFRKSNNFADFISTHCAWILLCEKQRLLSGIYEKRSANTPACACYNTQFISGFGVLPSVLPFSGCSCCSEYSACHTTQWSNWLCFTPLLTRPPGPGCQGCQKSGRPNWSLLWSVGALRFSQNWRNCEKLSKLNKNFQRNPVFWRFFEFYSIWAES